MEVSDLLPLITLAITWGTEEQHKAPEKLAPQHDYLGGVSSHLSDQLDDYFSIIFCWV